MSGHGPVMADFIQVARRYGLATSAPHMAVYCLVGSASEAAMREMMGPISEALTRHRLAELATTERMSTPTRRGRFMVLEGGRPSA